MHNADTSESSASLEISRTFACGHALRARLLNLELALGCPDALEVAVQDLLDAAAATGAVAALQTYPVKEASYRV